MDSKTKEVYEAKYALEFAEAKKGLEWLLQNEIEYAVSEVAAIFPDAEYAAKQIKRAYPN